MQKYNPKKIESKWQKKWYASPLFKARNGTRQKNIYLLNEFPYPSGDGLHVGHCRPYIGLDIIARKRRMEGFNVLYPMGWDAFGLPTENYAIKKGVHPAVVTQKNTKNFKRQMSQIGLSFDWSREINTTDPKYYKWTQWIFIKLFEKGLAYKDKININWCPSCKTGLANEEVVNGKCERCGTAVEKREKEQWLIKITKYADRLVNDLKLVDYPERVRAQQVNWIGKSDGAEITFTVEFKGGNRPGKIPVFTTRPDTLFGATYLVFSPEHLWVTLALDENHKGILENADEVRAYVQQAKHKGDLERSEQKEKTGVKLEGVWAVNPVSQERIPIFVADYVLAGYGTGAVMGVPAHDQRDFEFAKKYNLPVKHVVMPRFIDHKNPHVLGKQVVFRKGIIGIVHEAKTGKYLGLNWKTQPWKTFIVGGLEGNETPEVAARREILEETGYKNLKFIKILGGPVQTEFFAAHKNVNRVAHTWMVLFDLENEERDEVSAEEMAKHEVMWLEKKDINDSNMTHAEINLILDRMNNGEKVFEGEGIVRDSGKFDGMDSQKAKWEIAKSVGAVKTVQYKLRDWIFSRQHYWGEPIPMVYCESCERLHGQGWQPVAEKELPVELPKVKKYQPTDTGESPLSAIEKWVNVKCPRCGNDAQRETDTMPNWAGSNWYYMRYADPKNNKKLADEKALKYWMPVDWYNGGMEHTTLHLLYSRFIFKFLWDVGAVPKQLGPEPYKKRTSHGIVLAEGGVKMSKSKGNVVNPDDVIKQYGADTLRVYEMFMGPFEQMIPWDTKGIIGSRRFLEKVYKICLSASLRAQRSNPELTILLNKTIKKVGDDIEAMKFNTAISALMTFVNEWQGSQTGLEKKDMQKFLMILSPFAPHLAEELWNQLGFKGLCSRQAWPKYTEVKEDKITMVVSVNGKVRDTIQMQSGLSQKAVEGIVLGAPKIKPWIEGKQTRKIIFVPDKLINIVI